MARSKPSTPMRREPSDTFVPLNGTSHRRKGSLGEVMQGVEKEIEMAAEVHARNPVEQKQAGLGQLIICVGGIYASLSVLFFPSTD